MIFHVIQSQLNAYTLSLPDVVAYTTTDILRLILSKLHLTPVSTSCIHSCLKNSKRYCEKRILIRTTILITYYCLTVCKHMFGNILLTTSKILCHFLYTRRVKHTFISNRLQWNTDLIPGRSDAAHYRVPLLTGRDLSIYSTIPKIHDWAHMWIGLTVWILVPNLWVLPFSTTQVHKSPLSLYHL